MRVEGAMDRRAAKKHWDSHVAKWSAWAEDFLRQVQAIEDPALRHCVASILDGIASGFGHVLLRRAEPNKLRLAHFDLDRDIEKAVEMGVRTFDADADYPALRKQADAWIKARFKDTNAVQVAWTLGPLRDESPYEEGCLGFITVDGIVYDVKKGQFVGVKFDGGGIYKVSV